jgi:CheY-like chemotaxis protein
LFNLLGYETRTAYNGREAVDAVIQERPDVIVLDLHMPVLDGFGAAREIRSRHPAPPPLIVAMSALAGPAMEDELRDCGFDHYVTKPADVLSLVALVERGSGKSA